MRHRLAGCMLLLLGAVALSGCDGTDGDSQRDTLRRTEEATLVRTPGFQECQKFLMAYGPTDGVARCSPEVRAALCEAITDKAVFDAVFVPESRRDEWEAESKGVRARLRGETAALLKCR